MKFNLYQFTVTSRRTIVRLLELMLRQRAWVTQSFKVKVLQVNLVEYPYMTSRRTTVRLAVLLRLRLSAQVPVTSSKVTVLRV